MIHSAQNVQSIARDITGLCGLGAITYGAWLVYHPAGFIVGGIFAVTSTILLNLVDQNKKAAG